MTEASKKLEVLVLSANYPSPAAPQRGLWVERMCEAAARDVNVTVIVPTPWVPPGVPLQQISRFRRVKRHERRGKVDVHFPRVPGNIDYYTHRFDARLAWWPVLRLARRLHRRRRFDVIHAHFIYPDGVVAARLGQDLHVPVMTSEHAFWRPWLVKEADVGRQVDRALAHIDLVAPVSEFLRKDVDDHAAGRVKSTVLPNVVDDETFSLVPRERDPYQLLFVGLIRHVKRVDVLVRALAIARETEPRLTLKIVSAKSYAYSKDRAAVHRLVDELGLRSAVQFVTGLNPSEVAEAMRRAALVVVSSARRETFCSVAAEALACGTPVVSTRCGGPDDFITEADGVLVEPEDAHALAEGIVGAWRRRNDFDPQGMHDRIVQRFGRDAFADLATRTYQSLANDRPRP